MKEELEKILKSGKTEEERIELAYMLGQADILFAVGICVSRMTSQQFAKWQYELREEEERINGLQAYKELEEMIKIAEEDK